jgi:hypothetical protein
MTSRSSLETTMAHILRVLCLRIAMDPQSAWAASRSAISALHGDIKANGQASDVLPRGTEYDAGSSAAEGELRSRLHWVATALHTWICNEHNPTEERRNTIAIPYAQHIASSLNHHLPSLIYRRSSQYSTSRSASTTWLATIPFKNLCPFSIQSAHS